MNNASQKELATAEYWEKRYADDSGGKADGAHGVDNYEWFKTYDKLKPFLHKHLSASLFKPQNPSSWLWNQCRCFGCV